MREGIHRKEQTRSPLSRYRLETLPCWVACNCYASAFPVSRGEGYIAELRMSISKRLWCGKRDTHKRPPRNKMYSVVLHSNVPIYTTSFASQAPTQTGPI